MIKYFIEIRGSQTHDKLMVSKDVTLSEISILTFLLNQKLVELAKFDSAKKFSIKYKFKEDKK